MSALVFTLDSPPDTDVATTEEGVYELNAQHAAEGISHLIELFRQGPRNQAFLAAILAQVQELEEDLFALGTSFDPDTATGKALQLIGKLVGEPQLGRGDDEYRSAIRVRVRVNRSNGKPDELYEIGLEMFSWLDAVPVVSITEAYPATIDFEFRGDLSEVSIDTAFRALFLAKAGGVKLGVTYAHELGDEYAAVWAATDADDTLRGWAYGTDADSDMGGDWSGSL